ncbi:MAG: 2'-5' RNA ligase [Candidatus Doudnabacteria bacterium RIFCSPHIGHO2_01_FULL_46_14]|uniref:RNA 2',3'-cyclic phosphodiesterase n=1 Tax=Candidatus Doudnabacteria bacterium RIFCSPHIGHO2_01_FULL_46_14 TaxID=1817824 RepID=A0A1F5NNV6_9BACT|nr:MAG: 2'-5' RNA ligase [Candidatus Doudnabacteria bacterium RIFCSPHIGHO2_01_FULL_46_14]
MTSRCFVSIDLPNSVKEYLGRLAHHDIYWIKWANPKNFHITLNFLGELKPERIEEARLVLKQVAALYQPFNIKLAEVEPSRDMLWLLPEDNETLASLQDELKDKLKGARLGKRERRSYMPHILLARSKTGRNMRPVIENFSQKEFVADKINLYESELTPGSATHRLIESFPLA